MTEEHADSVRVALVIGRRAQLDMLTYETENDSLRKAVGEKNLLILDLQKQIALQTKAIDSFSVVARLFNSGLNTQAEAIKLLNRPPKRFALSIGAGYGAILREGVVYAGPGVFAGITFQLIKF